MRAAIVHYWLLNRRGGEKVLDSLCRLLPDADVFTLFLDPRTLSPELRRHKIATSFLNPLRRAYRSLLPLMPLALESLDLRGYDLVVSSESGPAKGVITSSSTHHLCYCHTPMRYLWDLYADYRNEWTTSKWKRAAMTPLTNYLRLWDYASAAPRGPLMGRHGGARGPLRGQQRKREEAHLEDLPPGVRGGSPAGGCRGVLLETAGRLLPDRV